MSPELEHLIRLQEIETKAADAGRRLSEAPERIAALDSTLAAAREEVDRAKQAIADNQTARRLIEKDLAVVQQRQSKYKDQLMEVKTNREYHAMQTEIATANAEVGKFEERILIGMVEADDLTAKLKTAEQTLVAEEARIRAERSVIERDAAEMKTLAASLAREREGLVARMPRNVVELFERVSKGRHGLAVVPARDERCSECHVRLRPQVFNHIRKNDQIVQCDSCQRILYFVAAKPTETTSA
ncbi:MAG: C4-type zinc ribbon domain-containing protein [Acidobacteria bacterium]|nr:C4-type zinc ribbon domain-containing protein [Acidobacteriota bacterium]